MQTEIYEFGEFILNSKRKQLFRKHIKERVKLTPKSFKLLHFLIEHKGITWSTNDLLNKNELWGEGNAVEPRNVAQTILIIRKALNDQEEAHKFIDTINTEGYCFIGKVRIISEEEFEALIDTLNLDNDNLHNTSDDTLVFPDNTLGEIEAALESRENISENNEAVPQSSQVRSTNSASFETEAESVDEAHSSQSPHLSAQPLQSFAETSSNDPKPVSKKAFWILLTLALLIISGLLYEKYSKKNPGLTEITIEKANVVLDMNSGEWHELTKEQRESDISYSKTFRTIEYTVKKHLEADLFIHRIGNESKISPDLEIKLPITTLIIILPVIIRHMRYNTRWKILT
jgi:DNA-binding winged helix-turn-helix (wHTH) protein